MYNLFLIRNTQTISLNLLNLKQGCFSKKSGKDAGFSLIEVVVVVLMLGILAAISLPSWLAFVNRQQANKASDVILSALQTAQREARRQKLSYSVSFTTESNTPYFVIYPTAAIPSADKWKNALEDLGTNPRKLLIGTNLTSENTGGSTVTYASTARSSFTDTNKPPQTITFDYMGALDFSSLVNTSTNSNNITSVQNSKIPAQGLIIAIDIPKGATAQNTDVKRCVIVKTLLGSIKKGKDAECVI